MAFSWLGLGVGRGPVRGIPKGQGEGKEAHLAELNYGLDLLSQSQVGKVTFGERLRQQDVIGFNRNLYEGRLCGAERRSWKRTLSPICPSIAWRFGILVFSTRRRYLWAPGEPEFFPPAFAMTPPRASLFLTPGLGLLQSEEGQWLRREQVGMVCLPLLPFATESLPQ